jgi:hypothetical protein
MRTPIAFATFLGLGAVAVGVGAAPQPMAGSDTLFDIISDGTGVLVNCVVNGVALNAGTSPINYIGTGSGNGENAMEQVAAPLQHVAPMSSFLSKNANTNNICNVKETGTTQATAEGINFALDGIIISSAKTSGADPSCTGTTGLTAACDATGTDINKGLAFNSVVTDTVKLVPGPNMVVESVRTGDDILVGGTQNNTAGTKRAGIERILPGPNGVIDTPVSGDDVILPAVTYTFTDWRDVLKVIYGGVDTIANTKSCASPIRHAVVDNYSNIFQTGCSTGATQTTTTATSGAYSGNGCRPKTCTGTGVTCGTVGDGPAELRHALRRDDASGTTDTFVSLLGLTKPKSVNDAACFNNFCNGFTGAFPTEDLRADNVVGDDVGTANQDKGGAYDWDYQDYDPIRRRCTDSDAVCDRRGTLGVVLAIVPTDFLSRSQAFALTADTGGKAIPGTGAAPMLGSAQVSSIPVYHACSGQAAFVEGRCPNGATQQTGCQWPNTGDSPGVGASFANFAANYNGKSNIPTESPADDVLFAGWQVGNADGRVYNKFVRDLTNADPRPLLTDTKKIGTQFRKITGANYRLHAASEGLGNGQELPAAGGTPLCIERDATSQIGCLTGNDPCSIGFAGRGSLTSSSLINPIRLNQQAPSDDCIQRLLGGSPTTAYKLSRRLFLNTVVGFESAKLSTNELALAQCMSKPSVMRTIITGHDFVPNGPSGSDGAVCYDYNPLPAAQCGVANTADACVGNNTIAAVTNCPNCGTIPGSTGFALP